MAVCNGRQTKAPGAGGEIEPRHEGHSPAAAAAAAAAQGLGGAIAAALAAQCLRRRSPDAAAVAAAARQHGCTGPWLPKPMPPWQSNPG
eukprot:scaffold6733_cov19-Tisochrysis_lutea.AAC.2